MLVPRDYVHILADFVGVPPAQLRDRALMSGLLIAAASAAGLNATAAPVVRTGSDGGVSAVLLTDPCHLSVHSLPDRGLALVDILGRDAAHAARALDVFVRRLAPASVSSETRTRG